VKLLSHQGLGFRKLFEALAGYLMRWTSTLCEFSRRCLSYDLNSSQTCKLLVIFCRQLTKILECFEIVPLLVSNFLQVRDIPCGTKGGVMISFEKIEVLSAIWSTLRVKVI